MIELHRTYRFCASHVLRRDDWSDAKNLEQFGGASNPSGHGHNYRLTVVVTGNPDPETGRVADFGHLDRLVETHVLSVYDHKNMNKDVDTLRGSIPTVEVVLRDIWDRIDEALPPGRLTEVRLQQDEFTLAVYRGPSPPESML
jgi:6-pyruvoyltetrahydropterin/6-carboxytetrahydropterin synthase